MRKDTTPSPKPIKSKSPTKDEIQWAEPDIDARFCFDEGRCECVRINKHGQREKATVRVDDDGMLCGICEDQDKEGNSMLFKWNS